MASKQIEMAQVSVLGRHVECHALMQAEETLAPGVIDDNIRNKLDA